MFDETIEEFKEEMISSTCELIKIPSVNFESEDPYMPFGENCTKALNYVLSLAENLGFRTKNIDHYCGYVEFGEGEQILGIIGHLDVVPEGENWSYPPFEATIANGNIYGRGAIDDKGPVIASLYAMKAVMEHCKVNKRVRLILGLNEETNWKGIYYYKQHEEIPTFGFSPDADFPCIYAEKGVLSVSLSSSYNFGDAIKIVEIDCLNNAINVVPKYCLVRLSISNVLDIHAVFHALQELISYHHFKITSSLENDIIVLQSYGTPAHAAHPDLGINAISQLLVILNELFQKYRYSKYFIRSIL